MIILEKMNASEFKQYLDYTIPNYAEEHIKAGKWEAHEALSKATEAFNTLLPEGENTINHYLFTIRNKDRNDVGMIWLGKQSDLKGFIYDINIWKGHRGKYYGEHAMREIENVGREIGLETIGLYVFGHNQIAQKLYSKVGYELTNIKMSKNIKESANGKVG